MSIFHLSGVEAPAKKKVNYKALDKVVTEYINGNGSFKINIETSSKQPIEITFSTFVTPLLFKAYSNLVCQSCLTADDVTKAAIIDEGLLTLMTHWFVIDRLSTMPVPVMDDDQVDMDKIAAYGTYFTRISDEYRRLVDSLLSSGWRACESLLEQFNALASDFDVNQFLANPEMMGTVQEMLRNANIH